MSAITRNVHVLWAGPGFALDLSKVINEISVPSANEYDNDEVMGETYVPQELVGHSRSASTSSLRTGPMSRELKQRPSGSLFVIDANPAIPNHWDGGVSIHTGLAESGPSTGRIVNTVNWQQGNDVWINGTVAVPFAFTSATMSVDLPTFTNDMRMFVVATEKSVAAARVFRISDGSANATGSITGSAGMVEIDISGLASSVPSGTMDTQAALASGQTVSGWVLGGTEYAAPNPPARS